MHKNYLRLTVIYCLFAIFLTCLLTLFTGCNGIRFAPTAAQQQSAELTYNLASAINSHGTDPQSPASQKLVDGTMASLIYTGRPSTPPDISNFETINSQAGLDAQGRPAIDDVFAEADGWLGLAGELAILLGFGGTAIGGKKALEWIALARSKSKALSEVVSGNEVLKKHLEQAGDSNALNLFKQSQQAIQKDKTPSIVALERVESNQPVVVLTQPASG